jgi:aryl-alcohol dehydrogenase-like predicted oxidoreductase
MVRLGHTDLQVYPLCLGGNVFGWTADEQQSFEVLDAYAAAGGNFVDTADSYSAWVPGHAGGESETIIGRWMTARGTHQRMVIATKVGSAPGVKGLRAATIRAAADASLKRLGVDHIDLYYAHVDDEQTPLDETLRAFDTLVKEGKVRYVAASNYSATRLTEALAISAREGLTRYVALQTHYNLAHRHEYEGDLRDTCLREHLPCLPYFALARGFLTGKYRPGTHVDSPRASGAQAYLTEQGLRLLSVLDSVAIARETTAAAVALAWLKQQPSVAAPIASARTAGQLTELLPMADLTLTEDELGLLSGPTG